MLINGAVEAGDVWGTADGDVLQQQMVTCGAAADGDVCGGSRWWCDATADGDVL